MKCKILLYIILYIQVMTFSACDKDAHKNENGLIVSLLLPHQDVASDIRLWIYQKEGALIDEYHYVSSKELSLGALKLPAGEYVLIAATNLITPFAVGKKSDANIKPYEGLLFQLGEASASPAHAHYGIQTIAVSGSDIVRTQIKMKRILAELQFTIKNLPVNIEKVEITVNNVAKGFLPYSNQLLPEYDRADLGHVVPKESIALFPMMQLMPTVRMQEHVTSDINTLFTLNFYYTNGSIMTVSAVAPAMINGGSYTPEIDFNVLRPNMTITINAINGWVEGETVDGEILNPNSGHITVIK